jgi:electron transfer flavoprotein beta subunit
VKIVALCKHSLDVAEIKVDRATRELKLAGVPARIGGIDRNVIEAAVCLKEANGGSVEGLCFGPTAARDGFKDVLAMGVDEMTLIVDPFEGAAEPEIVVEILAAAIRVRGPFDLVLCGFASDDGYTYQVGPRLAERLGAPLVSYARQVRVSESALEVERDLEDRLQTVAVRLPAIVSIAEEAFPPRRTTLMDALKARQKPVNTWQLDEHLGLSSDQLRTESRVTASAELGVYVERRQLVLKGNSLEELADGLIDALLERRVLQEAAR